MILVDPYRSVRLTRYLPIPLHTTWVPSNRRRREQRKPYHQREATCGRVRLVPRAIWRPCFLLLPQRRHSTRMNDNNNTTTPKFQHRRRQGQTHRTHTARTFPSHAPPLRSISSKTKRGAKRARTSGNPTQTMKRRKRLNLRSLPPLSLFSVRGLKTHMHASCRGDCGVGPGQ